MKFLKKSIKTSLVTRLINVIDHSYLLGIDVITDYLKKIFKPKTRKSQVFLDFTDTKHNGIFDVKIGIEAYRKNVIVYRCINLIAQSASHVPWLVIKRNSTDIIKNHPIYHLLKKPNPEKAGADFFGEIIASKLLFGNAYVLSTSLNDSPPKECKM